MDENQQLWVIQELGRLLPSIRGGGRRGESSGLPRFGAGESSVSATDIILVRHGFPQHGQLKKYGDQKQHQRNHGYLCCIKNLMLLRQKHIKESMCQTMAQETVSALSNIQHPLHYVSAVLL